MDSGMYCPDSVGVPHDPEGSHCVNLARGFSLVLQN